MRQSLLLPLLLLVAVSLPAAPERSLWSLPFEPPPESSTAFTSQSFPTTMSDSIFAMAAFEDGRVLMFSLFHYEAKLFEKWGIYLLLANPDGTGHWVTDDLSKNEVRFAEETLDLVYRSNRVHGRDSVYRITWAAGGIEFDLEYENYLEPWMLGDGIDLLGDPQRAFQRRSVFSPWARVTGTLSVDGITKSVRGEGVAEKTIIVNDLRKFNPELISMRVFDVYGADEAGTPYTPGLHIGLLDSTSHRDYGSKRMPRLFVARNGEWLFADDDYRIEFLEWNREESLPSPYPTAFRLAATGEGFSLDGIYRASVLFNITDILDELPKWLRSIVAIFVERPLYFRSHGSFGGTLTYPDGSVEPVYLAGPYEYVAVK